MNARSGLLTAVTVLGLVAVFLGERVVGAGTLRVVLDLLGVLAVVGAAVLRWNRAAATAAAGPRARVERVFAVLSTLALLALLDLVRPVRRGRRPRGAGRSRRPLPGWRRCCSSPPRSSPPWPSSPCFSASWRTPRWPGRPRSRWAACRTRWGPVWRWCRCWSPPSPSAGWPTSATVSADWSYFRPGRPSDSTRGLVRGLTEPVTLSLFYPPGSEVGAAARDYAESLASESPLLRVERLDAAVDLAPRPRPRGERQRRHRREPR